MLKSKFLGLSLASMEVILNKLFSSKSEDEYYIEKVKMNLNNNEMLQKISADKRIPHGQGAFQIRILYPGSAIKSNDSGIGTIGRFDHAHKHNNENSISNWQKPQHREIISLGNSRKRRGRNHNV